MKPRPSVALLIETSNAYARGILEGVIDWLHQHDPWSVYLPEQERGATPPAWLKNWKGDGIIARIETEEIARAVKRTGVPVVDVSAARRVPDIPWVETDDREIARLAGEHLLERGFRHLAFCGEPHFNWSRWREEAFRETVEGAGHLCHSFEARSRLEKGYSWNREQRRLSKWITKLPKPVGIMACYDIRAQQLLDTCRELELSVPEEVSVIGVDNDELLCNLCTPPLSSVIPDTLRTGHRAAELLDQMMRRKTGGGEAHLIAPLGIAFRQSTDILAIDDPDIIRAMQMIRERVTDGINVKDLLREIPLSRRAFEFRFQKLLGCTPHEMISRLRMDRVRKLLLETTLSLESIAHRCGFTHVEYMSSAFRKSTGMTPGAFRQGR